MATSLHVVARLGALLLCLLLVAHAEAQEPACVRARLERVKNGTDPVRGSNLGSWLIQEAWMVPWLWNDNGCHPNAEPGSYSDGQRGVAVRT